MFTRNNLSKLLPLYAGAWFLFAAVHLFIVFNQFSIGIGLAISEAVVFSLIPAILGVGLWFLVKFTDFEKFNLYELLVRHASMGAVTLFIWFGSGYLLMGLISGHDEGYMSWLDETLTLRIIAGFLIYVIVIIVFYLLINNQNLAERKIHEEALQNLLYKSELNALRAQIKPHFLFNALNSISSLTITNPPKAQEMVINLSDFMRYSLSFTGDGFSTLRQELNHVKLYLEIEKIRFGDRLMVEEKIDESAYGWTLPPMILQPLMENAVKHGMYDVSEKSLVRLEAGIIHDRLKISISNSYDPAANVRNGTGTGLQNVMKRFAMIYGIHNLVQVEKDEQSFKVQLSIPKNGKTQGTDH
ncbi:MAG: histidine kinase [Lentimicrobium sp.]|jgi:sensor histidine kinase YesM|nr:histidine kinase [Lentimicrobium sp.]